MGRFRASSEFLCGDMCRGLSRQPDPFSVLTSCPYRDPSTGEYSGTAGRSEAGRQRQLPIGTRRVADRERKAGLGAP
jgi:hypothetical protein